MAYRHSATLWRAAGDRGFATLAALNRISVMLGMRATLAKHFTSLRRRHARSDASTMPSASFEAPHELIAGRRHTHSRATAAVVSDNTLGSADISRGDAPHESRALEHLCVIATITYSRASAPLYEPRRDIAYSAAFRAGLKPRGSRYAATFKLFAFSRRAAFTRRFAGYGANIGRFVDGLSLARR